MDDEKHFESTACNKPHTSEKDPDEETNEEIKQTELKKRFRKTAISETIKILSKLTGRNNRLRKKVFCEIQSNSDVKVWTWTICDVTITCAKVFNPAILLRKNCKIENLKNMQHLEIEDPEEILVTFPKSLIGNLKKLETFSMSWTKIRSLPSNFYDTKLKHLIIQRNRFVTLNGISKACNLELLNASNNCIDSMPNDFGNLSSLTELYINNNLLKHLPESICSLASLKILDCSCNKLQVLPDNICNMIRLNTLDATANQLSHLPTNIGNIPELADLRVASNQLENLPHSFCNLKNLKSLNMRKNKLKEVPRVLENLPNLLYLNLRDNEICCFRVVITSLKHLNLNGNQLTNIYPDILKCCDLELLSLQKNLLTGIPKTMESLTNLKTILLSYNNISELPPQISELTSLKHIDLKGTKIRDLPTSMRLMNDLTYIEVDDCQDLDASLKLIYKREGIEGFKNYLADKAAEKCPESVQTRDHKIFTSNETVSMFPPI